MAKYPFETIEPKWQKFWDQHKTFKTTEDASFPKDKRRYVLDMFPYPSAQGDTRKDTRRRTFTAVTSA